MLNIFKYLKKSALSIIAIAALLAIQAVCDLSLPDYTAKIVNVGIQQGGVEYAVPEAIRQSEMERILAAVESDASDTVMNFYSPADKTVQNLANYPLLDREPLYLLEPVNKDTMAEIEQILGESIMLTANPSMNMMAATMSDSQIAQISAGLVRAEYEIIGMDIGAMQMRYILFAGLKMLGMTLISIMAAILVTLLSARTAAGLGMELRGRIFDKVVDFSNSEIDKFGTASLITRTTNDIQQIQMLMTMLFRIVIYAPILGVLGFAKALGTNSQMSWIIGVGVFAILSLVTTLFSVAMPRFKKMQLLVDRLNLVTREILTGLPVIRAFHNEKHEEKRFDIANTNLTDTNLFVNRVMTFMMPTMMLIMNGLTLLIIWVGAGHIDAGAMQIGDMMAFMQYAMQVVMAFLMLSMISIMLPRASVSAKRIMEVLDTSNSIKDPDDPKRFVRGRSGLLEFRNVCFRYPNAEEDVLSNISFTARPGETTAIIGSTGSGKSTLINLIPRFFDITSGQILIDGMDIREVTQHDLREKLGFVPQKGVLFSGTIESNIRFGVKSISDDQMHQSARIAQAGDFIDEKPDKYDSEISQGGSNVSGGQRQRLSIARAIAKNPEIYVFDDSFSALDYKTDTALRRDLREETQDSNVIIVAQRISTILHADQIIVLDEGRMAGIGTHKELLENCEVYRQIASSQLSKEELANE